MTDFAPETYPIKLDVQTNELCNCGKPNCSTYLWVEFEFQIPTDIIPNSETFFKVIKDFLQENGVNTDNFQTIDVFAPLMRIVNTGEIDKSSANPTKH